MTDVASEFVDHRGLRVIEPHAERIGVDVVVLRGQRPVAWRLVQLLGLRRVRAERLP